MTRPIDRLRLERLARGLRQQDVADLVGCDQSVISRVESGRKVREDVAIRIAKALCVDDHHVLFDEVDG